MGSGDAARLVGRLSLAAGLTVTGIAHFSQAHAFRAQVPPWFPAPTATIWISGVIELSFVAALLFTRGRARITTGLVLAGFFVVIFPGNISQYVTHASAFGMTSDSRRLARLAFQPVLVIVALWSTGAWPELSAVVRRIKSGRQASAS